MRKRSEFSDGRAAVWMVALLLFAGLILFSFPGYGVYASDIGAGGQGEDGLHKVVKGNIPEDIDVMRPNGEVDTIKFIDALYYHESLESHEEGIDSEEEAYHVCFGVTSAYLAIQYAVAGLFGEEIPESDDMEIFIAGSAQGALDTFELFLGKPAMTGNSPLNLDAFTVTAIRRSTGKRIVFGYDPTVVNPEFKEFLALKKAGKGCGDPELARVMNSLAGKVLAAGPFSCFVPVHKGGTHSLKKWTEMPGFLIIAHGFNKAWNDTVCKALSGLEGNGDGLYEVCFLEDFTGDGVGYIPPQQAYESLVRRGATKVVGIPLFVDSNSSHITEVRYVLGLEEMESPEEGLLKIRVIQGEVPIIGLTPAIDGHSLVGEAYARLILEKDNPKKENRIIIIAHGPDTDEDEGNWTANQNLVLTALESKLPAVFFVEHHLMTLRVLDFPCYKERLVEFGTKLKDFGGKGEVFLIYLQIQSGYLEMVVQGLPPGNPGRMMFPGCPTEFTLREHGNIIHLSQGLCPLGILPGIIRDRAAGWLAGEE